VRVTSDALITGEAMRDILMHQILETNRYPTITFTLDSLVGMTRQSDGIVGSAVGTLTVRGVEQPIVATARVFPDGGGMRVLAKWRWPVDTLKSRIIPRLRYFGLGMNTNLWHDFFMGADLVFHAELTGAN
jgi:polyisoprenoid-binding protein YceI